MALCRRYHLSPYREPGRRPSTVPVRAPKTFVERTLWPELLALSEELDAHLQELTDRVLREAIDEDVSEPRDVEPSRELTGAGGDAGVDHATNVGRSGTGREDGSPA